MHVLRESLLGCDVICLPAVESIKHEKHSAAHAAYGQKEAKAVQHENHHFCPHFYHLGRSSLFIGLTIYCIPGICSRLTICSRDKIASW
jgi:hypothetical protein